MPTPTIADRSQAAGPPKVMVALAHPTVRRYVCDLIEQGCRCWLATAAPAPGLAETVAELGPDAVVTDASGLAVLRGAASIPTAHVLVIGPDDDAYRDAALGVGVGAWVSEGHGPFELVRALDEMLERCASASARAGGCGCRG